jgi:hypothetical protein
MQIYRTVARWDYPTILMFWSYRYMGLDLVLKLNIIIINKAKIRGVFVVYKNTVHPFIIIYCKL